MSTAWDKLDFLLQFCDLLPDLEPRAAVLCKYLYAIL
jgi:hypothetical protein